MDAAWAAAPGSHEHAEGAAHVSVRPTPSSALTSCEPTQSPGKGLPVPCLGGIMARRQLSPARPTAPATGYESSCDTAEPFAAQPPAGEGPAASPAASAAYAGRLGVWCSRGAPVWSPAQPQGPLETRPHPKVPRAMAIPAAAPQPPAPCGRPQLTPAAPPRAPTAQAAAAPPPHAAVFDSGSQSACPAIPDSVWRGSSALPAVQQQQQRPRAPVSSPAEVALVEQGVAARLRLISSGELARVLGLGSGAQFTLALVLPGDGAAPCAADAAPGGAPCAASPSPVGKVKEAPRPRQGVDSGSACGSARKHPKGRPRPRSLSLSPRPDRGPADSPGRLASPPKTVLTKRPPQLPICLSPTSGSAGSRSPRRPQPTASQQQRVKSPGPPQRRQQQPPAAADPPS
eukprot:TRINITY_DN28957_c0_g1_i2.p1 TRINITY_DN28957_c0_g1~~TRINITY_DN28957_c0_g1_i2.p1  ORF type:complete len:420 (+),score=77.73 TRINITY_DN28957_c0_g1_i2:59-1261(+)